MTVTDEEAALQAIASFVNQDGLSKEQQEAKFEINKVIASDDPFIDICELFANYNVLYFRSLLVPRIEVSWSPRLTLCAGICELVQDPNNGNKYTRIRLKLSEALLKYRPRSDVIDTLLHEAIHAYFFVTTDWKHVRGDDGTGHGEGFLLLTDAINAHGGYSISVHHTFHDEVDSYRTHVWQCNGTCREQGPYFGLVKRSMNRAPGKNDFWWSEHEKNCGGAFNKIAEPKPTKDQLRKLSTLERAGRQRNKIDSWIRQPKGQSADNGEIDDKVDRISIASENAGKPSTESAPELISKITVACPVCSELMIEEAINSHLDIQHLP